MNYAEKIAALFTKAERTDNENEREAFTAAALKLMARWGVDDAMADAARTKAGQTREAVIRGMVDIGGSYTLAWRALVAFVSEGVGTVKLVQSGHKVHVFGVESDVRRFEMLINLLRHQAEVGVKQYWANHPRKGRYTAAEGFRERRQFLISFANTVGERLKAENADAVADTPGSGLVLVDRAERAALAAREAYPKTYTPRSRGHYGGSRHAAAAGREAGQRARLTAHQAVTT